MKQSQQQNHLLQNVIISDIINTTNINNNEGTTSIRNNKDGLNKKEHLGTDLANSNILHNEGTLKHKISNKIIINQNFIKIAIANEEEGFKNNCIFRSCKKNPTNLVTMHISQRNVDSSKDYLIDMNSVFKIGRKFNYMQTCSQKKYFDGQNIIDKVIELSDLKISRHHCDLINSNGTYKLADRGSLNGSYKRLNDDEYIKLNKNILFVYMNIEFTIEGFYKEQSNSKCDKIYIKLLIGNINDNNSILISSQDCVGYLSISPFSENFFLKKILKDSCEKLEINVQDLNRNHFPRLFFRDNSFFLYPKIDCSNLCDVLIKLNDPILNNDYVIDINLNDKFILGGDTFLTLIEN